MITDNATAHAVNTVIHGIVDLEPGRPKPHATDVCNALAELADAAYRKLGAGVTGDQVFQVWQTAYEQGRADAWLSTSTADTTADLIPACRVCGCTEDAACEGGCFWVPTPLMVDLCSACVATIAALDKGEGLRELVDVTALLPVARALYCVLAALQNSRRAYSTRLDRARGEAEILVRRLTDDQRADLTASWDRAPAAADG